MRKDDGGVKPRVSILIPNYNNGRESSHSGQRNLIEDLLRSLRDTLSSDTTPFEIIAYDDGSTDDSLETLRAWSKKRWPDGRAFLELIEAEHTGVLAKTANILTRRARGDILARLDGDIVCLTPNWVTHLARIFDQAPPRVGVVGPKQLRPDMHIHAFGDWVLHPCGYTHVATGLDRNAVRQPLEVDHVMGCFYCHRREVFDDLGGYDEDYLRGQTVDFGLRARLKGWRCFAVPDIEFVHHHGLRTARSSDADTAGGVARSLDTFERKWGFSRIAPDLDEVRRRYGRTPLLWNPRFFGTDRPDLALPPAPKSINDTPWTRYANDPAYRNQIDLRIALAGDVVRQTGMPKRVLLLGSRNGLIAHLLAMAGLPVTSVEPTRAHAQFAATCIKGREYEVGAPSSIGMDGHTNLPIDDGQADLALVYDVLEEHPNPVGLIRELRRVLAPQKILALTSRRRHAREDAPTDHEHRYHWPQLLTQVQIAGGFALGVDPAKDDPSRDMIVLAQRRPEPKPAPPNADPRGETADQRVNTTPRPAPVGAAS